MNVTTNSNFFSRQPLPVTGKIAASALAGGALLCYVLVSFIGFPGGIPLTIVGSAQLLAAAITLIGLRWTPLFGTLVSGGILIDALFFQSYVVYNLRQPRQDYTFFVVIVLLLACLLTAVITSLTATIQNYRGTRRMPVWGTQVASGIVGIVIGAILIGTLAPAGTVAATTNGVPTVHMGPGSFSQSSITIGKGAKLLLVDDGSFVHIIANGTWVNNTPKPVQEAGAPTVNNVQVNGNSIDIGPFTTAGTYHIYCTIHPGMSLTITVQ